MIMQGYDCRRHALDGRLEELAHAYLGRVHAAMVHLYDIQNAVPCIQEHDLQVFLFQQTHFILYQGSSISRRIDHRAFSDRFVQSQTERQGSFDTYGRLLADTSDRSQFGNVGLVDALNIPAKAGQDSFGDFDLLRATDHCGQEFGQAAGGGI